MVVLIGIWLYLSGSPRATFHVGSRAYAVAFSPDGAVLATGGALSDSPADANGIIRLWDVASGRQIASWKVNGYHVAKLSFDPGGKTLTSIAAIPSQVTPKCELRRWDLANYKELEAPRPVEYPADFPVESPTGNVIAKHGGWGVLAICEGESADEIYRVQADRRQLNCAALSPDGSLFATGGGDTVSSGPSPIPWVNGDVRLWEVRSGRHLATYNRHWAPIEAVTFSPNGRLIASASLDGTAKLWEVPGR
jgi:hypothetical protein